MPHKHLCTRKRTRDLWVSGSQKSGFTRLWNLDNTLYILYLLTKCISPGIKRGLYFHISSSYADCSGLVNATLPTGAHVNIMSMHSMLGGHLQHVSSQDTSGCPQTLHNVLGFQDFTSSIRRNSTKNKLLWCDTEHTNGIPVKDKTAVWFDWKGRRAWLLNNLWGFYCLGFMFTPSKCRMRSPLKIHKGTFFQEVNCADSNLYITPSPLLLPSFLYPFSCFLSYLL